MTRTISVAAIATLAILAIIICAVGYLDRADRRVGSLPLRLPRKTECPDPHERKAEIGGHEISATVFIGHTPVAGARGELFSGRRLVWAGAAGWDGQLEIRGLPSGVYTLKVERWGTTTVRLNPKLDRTTVGQVLFYHMELRDGGCISTGVIMN